MRGVRVLDLSDGRAGAYCARLLAMAGADVVVGEPPEGSDLRRTGLVADRDGNELSIVWEYLRANTSTVIVDAGASLAELADGVDAVVLDVQGELTETQSDIAAAREAHPELVVAAITPYGFTGPKSAWRAGPLEHWALGGHMNLNGEPDRHPLPGGGPWLTHLVGATAAISTQAALVNAATADRGDLVEISALEALTSAHQWSFSLYTHNGVTKQRWGNRFGEQHHPLALYECIDGWVCIAAVSIHQWEGFCVAMDQVELLARDDFYVPAVRFDHADELDEIIRAWAATKTVAEAVAALQDNQVPSGPVASLDDMLASPQLAARDYWVNLNAAGAPDDDASGARLPGPPARIHGVTPQFRRAPALGAGPESAASNERRWPVGIKPLAGVRVVEFTIAWAGPLVCRMLADLGADVIKIEHPTARGLAMPPAEMISAERGDWVWGQLPGPLSRNGIFLGNDPGVDWFNRLGHWNKMNRSKRDLCLDVKAPGGRDVLRRLVATADIVVNNYSPRGVRSLGITAAELREINPYIVTLDMSGFGATGPDAENISWGPVLDAASGLAFTTGYPDSGPYKQGIAFPDVVGGLHGTVIALASLWQHWRTGEPVAVDLSQLETAIAVAGDQFGAASLRPASSAPPPRRGARSSDAAPAGVYRCRGEDAWLALTVTDDEAWQALAGILQGECGDECGSSDWAKFAARQANHDAIDAVIERWASARNKHEAAAELQAAGIAASAVMTIADIVNDDHSTARGLMVDLARPGEQPQHFPGLAFRFDTTPADVRPPPKLGEHNEAILAELGYEPDEIADLYDSNTIATAPPA
ncbi:CoA transferase [Candidatus Poriferisodalis sp.]|uniref:CaiB/BaiF CoA-transferase family protein n=1 Tax=Candidatus Poriferisodalis sp. TaxID=3101277 RepID=UPI003D0F87BB